MKTLLSSTILILILQTAKSQVYIRHKNISADTSIRYFEIVVDPDPVVFFVYSIDYGKNRHPGREYIADSRGKRKKFRSSVDMLNYLATNGWKLARRDITSTARGSQTAFLLFERN